MRIVNQGQVVEVKKILVKVIVMVVVLKFGSLNIKFVLYECFGLYKLNP